MSVLILQRTGDKGSNRAEEHVVDAEGCMGHAGIYSSPFSCFIPVDCLVAVDLPAGLHVVGASDHEGGGIRLTPGP